MEYLTFKDILCMIGIALCACFFGVKMYQLGIKPADNTKNEKDKLQK